MRLLIFGMLIEFLNLATWVTRVTLHFQIGVNFALTGMSSVISLADIN